MKDLVDARGLSCPQPVLMTLEQIKKTSSNEVEIIVDNEVSRENVCRAVQSQGWNVSEILEEPEQYRIIISKT
ncbi:MAG: sulfurtransferase TusA family protein [Deltaproteobacteria bacterium]|nr:sulfurtransferase TusA family protein [Deltaproteobacteria bacterium]